MKAIATMMLIVAGVATAGCGSQRRSGFLGPDVSGFKKNPDGRLIWRTQEKVDLGRYRRLIIDPLQISYVEKSHHQGIHKDEIERLGAHVQAAARMSLIQYKLGQRPLPNTLRLRLSIAQRTEIADHAIVKRAKANPVSLDSVQNRVTSGSRLMSGPVALEAEILDAATGDRLLAIVEYQTLPASPQAGGATSWDRIDRALIQWAQNISSEVKSMSLP